MDSHVEVKKENDQNFLILIGILVFVLLCCVIASLGIFCTVTSLTMSVFNKSDTPPYYGVFIEKDGELVELRQDEIFNIPTEGEMRDAEEITDTRPKIIVWRDDISLGYLALYKLGEYNNGESEIEFNAVPIENGVLEISPASRLEDGSYCLVQGNPLGVFLPGWCFKIITR